MIMQARLARRFLYAMLSAALVPAMAQTGPNAPTEAPASGAIIVPPTTGDGEAIRKKAPSPNTVDPGMVTPPPKAADARPESGNALPAPAPAPAPKRGPDGKAR